MKRIVIPCLAPFVALALSSLVAPSAAHANNSGCYAHRPKYIENVFEVRYDAGCSGHDEPELDPLSSSPGSARELTWTVVLPSDGAFPVSNLGPTFWFGGTVSLSWLEGTWKGAVGRSGSCALQCGSVYLEGIGTASVQDQLLH
jgi:hypothetical protein